jgi:hypothetical protein
MREALESYVRPAPLRLVLGGAYDQQVRGERELLEELYELLNRLAEDVDPVRGAVLKTWSRTVRGWLRLLR